MPTSAADGTMGAHRVVRRGSNLPDRGATVKGGRSMDDSSTSPTKACAKCGRTLPASSEFFGAERSGNLKSSCRECGRAYGAAHYSANRGKIAAHQAAYRSDHRAQLRERSRVYNATHQTEHAAYRAAHLSQRNAYDVAYRREGAAGRMYRDWCEDADTVQSVVTAYADGSLVPRERVDALLEAADDWYWTHLPGGGDAEDRSAAASALRAALAPFVGVRT